MPNGHKLLIRLHGSLSLKISPAYKRAFERGECCLDGHVVHQLAIEEALPEQPDQQPPAFLAFEGEGEGEGEDGGQVIDGDEKSIVKKHTPQVFW